MAAAEADLVILKTQLDSFEEKLFMTGNTSDFVNTWLLLFFFVDVRKNFSRGNTRILFGNLKLELTPAEPDSTL